MSHRGAWRALPRGNGGAIPPERPGPEASFLLCDERLENVAVEAAINAQGLTLAVLLAERR